MTARIQKFTPHILSKYPQYRIVCLSNRQWWQTILTGEYQHYYETMYTNRQ